MEFAGYALWDAVDRFAIPGWYNMFSRTNTVLIFKISWVIQAEKLFKEQLKLKLALFPKR